LISVIINQQVCVCIRIIGVIRHVFPVKVWGGFKESQAFRWFVHRTSPQPPQVFLSLSFQPQSFCWSRLCMNHSIPARLRASSCASLTPCEPAGLTRRGLLLNGPLSFVSLFFISYSFDCSAIISDSLSPKNHL